MSATKRGAIREEQDFYATPEAAFKPIIPFIGLCKVNVWEPACGDRRLIRWLTESKMPGFVDGDDLTTGYDFLKDIERRHPCIVTNPPFSLAFEFCQHAVAIADHVFLLLRLNFLASDHRRAWFSENEPDALFILSKRPSFVLSCSCRNKFTCGHKWSVPSESPRPDRCPKCSTMCPRITTSDACDYAWYYWGKRHHGIYHL